MLKITDLSIPGLINSLSLQVAPGQRLGIIGESGSGKSLTALAIMGLLPPSLHATGTITVAGQEILHRPDHAVRRLRGSVMSMVFQEPLSALDPLLTIAQQLRYAGTDASALSTVDLDPALATRYPHELSGGQRQRVLIAMAMAAQPQLLICDEPTTALDSATQDGILELLNQLVQEHGTTLLFISHDLRVVRRMCTDVLVLHHGQVVEHGPLAEILDSPRTDYTRQLITAATPGTPAAPRPTSGTAVELTNVTKKYADATALTGINLHVAAGQRLGLVGGSGSGKSTILQLIAGLRPPTSGTVTVHGRVQMVFQDPQSALNPRLPIWKSVREGAPTATRAAVEALLTAVGIPASASGRYPHEFSGGQRQRISIARAIIGNPDILLADEAVSALDVSVRRTVLDLLTRLADERGFTLIFVTHDLEVLREVCDTVAVLSHGQIVEQGATAEIWDAPTHAYTRALIAAASR